VNLLARVVLLFGLIIQVVVRGVAFSMHGNPFAVETNWTPNVHLLILASGAAIWWRTRSGRRSARELAWLDVTSVAIPFGFSCIALWFAGIVIRPNLIHVLGMGNLLVLRAVLVPSSGRRTAAIGITFSAVLAAWTYAYYVRNGAQDIASPAFFTTMTSVWSSMAVIVSALASYTIFGLRKRVKEATQLGQYTLVRKIGEGGMGVVYEARHALLRRRTAIKLLPMSKAGEQNAARFEREVRLTSTLTHPNTIAVYDYGRSPDGVFYYAMEYLDGIDLQKLVDGAGAQPPGAVVHVLEQICGALAEAHGAGLIHRDIKPANVILCERGGRPAVAKVVDFGLVKDVEARDTGTTQAAARAFLGTPLYMSPEAINSPERVDVRSDLYAVGAVGYFLVTGSHVFDGATAVEVCAHHLHSPVVSPSERTGSSVPRELESILLDCLAKSPDARPTSASVLVERLAAARAAIGLDAASIRAWWDRCKALAHEGTPKALEGVSPTPQTTFLHVDLGDSERRRVT
jgi:serine/threonine-protein kinase